ncbi:MAG: amino acid permease [Tannerellaceae bacterium]|jgi:amino acid transporter|nr:amino acid permease [Tannerellaceae bacterium]
MKTNATTLAASGGYGTAPVFFTAISTILGAVLFLRFGHAIGAMGFWGTIGIVVMGHLVTIPTALAISEIATNTRVEGGGEYFIISRSFGLKIGSTIGFALYISQAISVAFYTIAFTEAFSPLFDMWHRYAGFELPRQTVSVPALLLLGWSILRKGTDMGMKMLYFVSAVLVIVLLLFFAGPAIDAGGDAAKAPGDSFGFFNRGDLFLWFAICFPAFTGMTAGVGLSGDLRNPGRSIPLGTMLGTLTGLAVYILVVWKLSVSASQADLASDQLIMSRIAYFGAIAVPVGLAACTFSSALGSVLVAPRTLQALASDGSFPSQRVNAFLAKGKGRTKEPFNATILTLIIALVFVMMGSINMVAQVISMFFLITYGTLCLISFINHFGSPPSYRPRFRSKWYFSLGGFLISVWIMFMINPLYTIVSSVLLTALYLFIEHYKKDEKGLMDIFGGALFQLNRRLRVFMQKNTSTAGSEEWRPSALCISRHSFERDKVLEMMKWISHRHGFGTYFHYIEGYYDAETRAEADRILRRLIDMQRGCGNSMYIDTMISPSYTSAIAQVIQSPSISGMENNMVIFEYDKSQAAELARIASNISLAKAGDFDVCIFAGSSYPLRTRFDIHVWIRDTDELNTNLMILLGYIILAHPDWSRSKIRIFIASQLDSSEEREHIRRSIETGRLPITLANIEIVSLRPGIGINAAVAEHSRQAGLIIMGFDYDMLAEHELHFGGELGKVGDILFVNASHTLSLT